MTNHVTNRLIVTGPSNEVERFIRKTVSNPDDHSKCWFSFGSIIPIPEGENPAEWCREHWWTRGCYALYKGDDLFLAREPERLVLRFATANALPLPIYEKLGELFPRLTFHVAGYDEYLNFGFIGLIENGRCVIAPVDGGSVASRLLYEAMNGCEYPDGNGPVFRNLSD